MSYCTDKKINKFNSRKTDERMNKNRRRDEGCIKLKVNKESYQIFSNQSLESYEILESFYIFES